MTKRTMVDRTMRQARSVMKNYVRPGAKTASETASKAAESTLQEVMYLMGEARDLLAQVTKGGTKKRVKRRAATKRRKTRLANLNRVKKRRKTTKRRKGARRKKR